MKKIIALIIFSVISSLFFTSSVFAIGQVTAPIVIENVLRGQDVTATLNLFNSEGKETVYGLLAEGDIADWVSFYKVEDRNMDNAITQIVVPSKVYQNVTVRFSVPQDMPNREYTGKVYIFTKPEDSDSASDIKINVGQRVGRPVSIVVTDEEVFDFNTIIIPLKYEIEEGEPLIVKGIYANSGNVLVEPDLQLKITKDNKTVFNAIFPFDENEDPIRSLETRIFPSLIKWQTDGQDVGRYRAEIKVMLNGEVFQEKGFRFSIVKPGVVLGSTSSKIFWSVVFAIVLIVLLGVITALIIKVRTKAKEIN